MKIRRCRQKVIVFVFSIILIMGIAACSFDTSGGTTSGDAVGPMAGAGVPQEPAASQPETPTVPEIETPKPETPTIPETEVPLPDAGKTPVTEPPASENNGGEHSDMEDISVGDPIIGIVDKFADNIIVIKDAGDPDRVYYFSTQNAQVVEGDSPIAVGDRVAIFYRGVMGDEEHPGEAVKVVTESMMYQ